MNFDDDNDDAALGAHMDDFERGQVNCCYVFTDDELRKLFMQNNVTLCVRCTGPVWECTNYGTAGRGGSITSSAENLRKEYSQSSPAASQSAPATPQSDGLFVSFSCHRLLLCCTCTPFVFRRWGWFANRFCWTLSKSPWVRYTNFDALCANSYSLGCVKS